MPLPRIPLRFIRATNAPAQRGAHQATRRGTGFAGPLAWRPLGAGGVQRRLGGRI